MRGRLFVGAVVLFAATALVARPVLSQDKAKPPEPPKKVEDHPKKGADPAKGPDAEKGNAAKMAEMEAWMKAGTTGEHHAHLKPLVGSWKCATKWWQDPKESAQESTGTMERKMIMGDRFLQEEYKGTMMDMPFTGMGFCGYDNLKKKYVSTWMDSMSTMIMTMTGTCDGAGKSFTFTGEHECPITGKMQKMRTVLRIESPDKHVMEMYGPDPDGKEFRNFEMICTRVK